MERADAVEELKRVYSVLNGDLVAARAVTVRDPSDFNKRTLVRTCAALVEGLSYQLRQVTLVTLDKEQTLSDGERAVLQETRHSLSGQGTVEERDNFQATLPMLLFTLKVYAKNHGAEFEPNTKDNGWNCLRKAFALRDRLMHPKSEQDLLVTDDIGTDFMAGIKWWDDTVFALLAKCEEADKQWLVKKREN